eukprot:SAG22_NODE_1773_length_3610_cov_2.056394_1_plen_256_part_10
MVYKIKVTYGGPRRHAVPGASIGLPDNFVLKLYDAEKLLPNAKRELFFYSALADKTPVRAPTCYWTKLQPEPCYAAPRCARVGWPSLEDFLELDRWCGFPNTPERADTDGTRTETDDETSYADSSWSESEFGSENEKPRPSRCERYGKLLRAVGIHNVGYLGNVQKYLKTLVVKGMKEADIVKIVEMAQDFQARTVYAALLLEDVVGEPAAADAAAAAESSAAGGATAAESDATAARSPAAGGAATHRAARPVPED